MTDREKVIKELEWQINVFTSYCASDDRLLEAMKATIALLKEQEAVVRCKDCRKNMMCEMTIHKPKDWFCADGERR